MSWYQRLVERFWLWLAGPVYDEGGWPMELQLRSDGRMGYVFVEREEALEPVETIGPVDEPWINERGMTTPHSLFCEACIQEAADEEMENDYCR